MFGDNNTTRLPPIAARAKCFILSTRKWGSGRLLSPCYFNSGPNYLHCPQRPGPLVTHRHSESAARNFFGGWHKWFVHDGQFQTLGNILSSNQDLINLQPSTPNRLPALHICTAAHRF